jgi:hypothetical protein
LTCYLIDWSSLPSLNAASAAASSAASFAALNTPIFKFLL